MVSLRRALSCIGFNGDSETRTVSVSMLSDMAIIEKAWDLFFLTVEMKGLLTVTTQKNRDTTGLTRPKCQNPDHGPKAGAGHDESTNINNMDAPPNDNPVLKAYESFVRSTPFVTRSLVISQFVTWTISFLSLDLARAFGNVPYFTVFRLEIYRLILSPLVGNSLLLTIFTSISFVEVGSRMEHSTGSTSFAWLLFVMTLAVNASHIVAALILYAITDNRNTLFSESVGLIMLFFGVVTIECFQASPGSSRRLFFTTVPSVYYPWALLALFTFLAGFQLSLPISIGFGFLFFKGELDFLKLDNGVFQRWESTSLASLVAMDGWIATDGLRTSDWNEEGSTGGLGPLSQLWGNAAGPQEEANTTGRSVGFGAAPGDLPQTGAAGSASNTNTTNFPAGGRTLGTASRRTAVDPRQARLEALERRSNVNTSQDTSNV